ncbi:MAG: SRPBCC domain-containing protein [Xanthobacteraceae bacterium]
MAARTKADATEPGDRALAVTRVFDAPRSLVFQAWTRKEHLDRWCAPRGFAVPYSEGELRPGGVWRCCMRSPGGVEHWVSGSYREIVENELLVFTHAWEDEHGKRGHETVVTVRFENQGGKTRLIFHQATFESIEARDGHAGGWVECLDRLADHLATLRVPSKG